MQDEAHSLYTYFRERAKLLDNQKSLKDWVLTLGEPGTAEALDPEAMIRKQGKKALTNSKRELSWRLLRKRMTSRLCVVPSSRFPPSIGKRISTYSVGFWGNSLFLVEMVAVVIFHTPIGIYDIALQ